MAAFKESERERGGGMIGEKKIDKKTSERKR